MQLAIDIGNTRIKTALFHGSKLLEIMVFEQFEDLKKYLIKQPFDNFILSKVGKLENDDTQWLFANYEGLALSHQTALPFTNLYKSPETLGLDRIAAVAGAITLFEQKNCLIIDAGTCITYDFVDQDNNYHGGAISPGLGMRYKAMHEMTASLPKLSPIEQNEFMGNSTASCMHAGAFHGILGEIQYFRHKYVNKFENVQLIITGGDGKYFESKIKEPIFAFPELVLVGLNRILSYNASI